MAGTKLMCLVMIMGLALALPALAINIYNVTGLIGWIPALVSSDLLQALLGNVFHVGDILSFKGPLGLPLTLPVYSVTADAFATCNVTAPLFSALAGTPNALCPLNVPGLYYFIADPLSCALGLKFSVNALAL